MLTHQTLVKLSQKQALLDSYILKKNHLTSDQQMFKKKIVAFIVELGEYANEERSFKYWSQKSASQLDVQLDEYIDGLHFLLSLGNDLNFDFENYVFIPLSTTTNIDTYLQLIQDLSLFISNPALKDYEKVLNSYLTIAQLCQYNEPELMQAYETKNQVNFERQNQNY